MDNNNTKMIAAGAGIALSTLAFLGYKSMGSTPGQPKEITVSTNIQSCILAID